MATGVGSVVGVVGSVVPFALSILIERKSIPPLTISSLGTTRPAGIFASTAVLVIILVLPESVICHFDSPFTTIFITVGFLDIPVTLILPLNAFGVFQGKAIILPGRFPPRQGSHAQV